MTRNGTLDHARLWAAFGIVVFHTGAPGGTVGYAGLPFFLMLLMLLGLPGAGHVTFAAHAASRARRLLLPWLIWSAVYGLLKLAEVIATGRSFASEFAPFMLLTGPAIHLWFLPFAFVASLALHPLGRLLPARSRDRRLLAGLAGLATLLAMAADQGGTLPAPLAQWRHALPAILLGIGLGVMARQPQWLAVAGVGGLGLAALGLGWTEGLLQLGLATLALLACLALSRPETDLARRAGEASLGVYLAHPLVMSVLERTTPLPEASLGLAVATAGGALGLTLVLSAARVVLTGAFLSQNPVQKSVIP